MKHSIYILLFLCIATTVNAQKKKNLQSHRVKTVTVTDQDFENSKGKSTKESYTRFDEQSNMVELIEYDNSGKEKLHETYEFDEDGNKVKEIQYKPNNVKDKVIEYKYEEGLRTERIVYYPNGKVKSKKKYVYEFH